MFDGTEQKRKRNPFFCFGNVARFYTAKNIRLIVFTQLRNQIESITNNRLIDLKQSEFKCKSILPLIISATFN